MTTLLSTLKEAREALQFANDTPGGPVSDTIWMMHRPETLFDFLDAAIADAEGRKAKPSEDLLDAIKGLVDFIEIDGLKMNALALQIAKDAIAAAEPEEAWDDIKLAEMIMSDCGLSSDYEPLKERIAKRIAKHVQSRTASDNSQLIAVLLNIGEWIQNLPIPTRGALAKLMKIDRAVAAVNAVPPTSGD